MDVVLYIYLFSFCLGLVIDFMFRRYFTEYDPPWYGTIIFALIWVIVLIIPSLNSDEEN